MKSLTNSRKYATAIIVAGLLLCGVSLQAQENAPADRVIDAESALSLIEVGTLEGHTMAVMGLAFSPDSRLLISASDDVSLRVWDMAQLTPLDELYPHASFTRGVAFNPDGSLLASVSWDRTVATHTIDENQLHLQDVSNPFPAIIDRVVFHPDGERLAFGVGDGTVHLVDAAALNEGRIFRLPSLQITALAFSPDGSLLAAAAGFPDATVSVWRVDGEEDSPVAIVTGHSGTVLAVTFAAQAEDDTTFLMATASDDGEVRLWSLETSGDEPKVDPLAVLTGDTESSDWITSVRFSPDGSLLAAASLESGVLLWDVRDPAEPEMIHTLEDRDGGLNVLAFSPDGVYLATAGQNGVVRLWGLDEA